MASEKLIIEIDLDLDTRDIRKVSKRVEKDLGNAGKKASNAFEKNFSRGLNNVFTSLSGFALTAGATLAAAFAGRELIQAAARQEEAVESLNNSLRRIGEFSEETSKDLQDFASSLQAVTRFGDEAIIEQLAFAQGLGATAEQSKEVVSAAADLATSLNIDLNSAVRNVGRTLGGFGGELSEVIPALKELTTEQLRAGEGIRLIADLFGGAARGDVNSFNATIDRLGNAFGDFTEALGSFVTASPAVRDALKGITDTLTGLTDELNQANSTPSQLERISQESERVREQLRLTEAQLNRVANSTGIIGFLNNLSGGTTDLEKKVKDFRSQLAFLEQQERELAIQAEQQRQIAEAKKVAQEEQAAQAERDRREQQLTELGIVTLAKIEENFTNRIALLEDLRAQELISEEEFNQQVLRADEDFQKRRLAITEGGNKARNKATFDANKAFGNIVASGTQTLVSSLLEGEKASDAFGKFILGSFGQLATQLGSFYIATGIANEALFELGSPASQIAAGVALTVLGGILSSFAGGFGGGGGAPATPSAGGGAGIDPTTDFGAGDPVTDATTDQVVEEELRDQNITNITVEGLIGGRDLVNLINDSIDEEGVTLNVGLA